ncbi:MAG: stage II sporulation protein E [Clostridiales bacterium]|nr:stage II sporulation protein E [Clostridiales bacterium]
MNKIHIFSQYHIKGGRAGTLSARHAAGVIVVFLLGRVVAFDMAAPFGPAVLAAYIANDKTPSWRYIAVAAAGLLGVLTSGASVPFAKYLLTYVLFGLIYLSVSALTDRRKNYTVSGMAGVSLLISGVIFSARYGFAPYDVLMLVLESACCVVAARLTQSAARVLFPAGDRPAAPGIAAAASVDEIAGLSVVAVLCALGLSTIKIGGLALGNSLAAALIMLFALAGGVSAGAAGGVALGVLYGVSRFPVTAIAGVFGFCGLAAGLMRRFDKAGAALGFFVANAVLSMYLGGFDGGTFGVLELCLAIALFCLLPTSVVAEAESVLGGTGKRGAGAVKFITQKLRGVAAAFGGLAGTFSGIARPEQAENPADVTALFDKAADKVCRKCGLRFVCWEKQFNATYDAMMKLAPVFRSGGKAEPSHLPEQFRSKCIKVDDLVAELNRVYGQYRLDTRWRQRVAESQELTAEQFTGMSRIIDGLASELDSAVAFDDLLEQRVASALARAGLKRREVSVVKNNYGRYEASVKMKRCADGKQCAEAVVPTVSGAIGREMECREAACARERGGTRCELYLVEKEKFAVACGAACRAKDGQSESGDNYSYTRVCDGKYVLALSDGMGSGTQAAGQSRVTVTMLEQLLGAGFDKHTAIKIINSALRVKTTAECFATIDLTILDLFSGEAEFIKIGANASFIKRGKRVEQINSSSLPVGILSDVDVEISGKTLERGDCVIMVSDGVHNAADSWLGGYLSQLDAAAPQAMAERILEEAARRKNQRIDDDMTVVAATVVAP